MVGGGSFFTWSFRHTDADTRREIVICLSVCLLKQTHRQTDRRADTQAGRPVDRQAGKQTHRQTVRETHIYTHGQIDTDVQTATDRQAGRFCFRIFLRSTLEFGIFFFPILAIHIFHTSGKSGLIWNTVHFKLIKASNKLLGQPVRKFGSFPVSN